MPKTIAKPSPFGSLIYTSSGFLIYTSSLYSIASPQWNEPLADFNQQFILLQEQLLDLLGTHSPLFLRKDAAFPLSPPGPLLR